MLTLTVTLLFFCFNWMDKHFHSLQKMDACQTFCRSVNQCAQKKEAAKRTKQGDHAKEKFLSFFQFAHFFSVFLVCGCVRLLLLFFHFFFFCLLLFLLSLSFSLFHSTSFPPLLARLFSLLISVFNFLFCFEQTVDTARHCRQFFSLLSFTEGIV